MKLFEYFATIFGRIKLQEEEMFANYPYMAKHRKSYSFIEDFLETAAERFADKIGCEKYTKTEKSDCDENKRRKHYKKGFFKVLYQLLTIVPIKNSNLKINLFDPADFTNGFNIDGTGCDDNGALPSMHWGIEYDDWGNWLAMEINEGQFFSIPATVVFAEVIWGMTWGCGDYTKFETAGEKFLPEENAH